MNAPKISPREAALRRAAEAAGPTPKPKAPKPEKLRYVMAHADLVIGGLGLSYLVTFDTQEEEITATFACDSIEEAEKETYNANHRVPYQPAPVENLAANRGDAIQIGRRFAIVTEVRGLEAGFGYVAHWILDKGRRLGEPTYTTSLSPLKSLGRWTGNFMREGAVGAVVMKEETTNKEGQVATVTKKKGKKGSAKAKPAAKKADSNGGEKRRTREDVDALVPKFVKHLTGGGKMKDLKAEFGFSDDGPIRAALYRGGFDAKGVEHEVEEESIDAGKAAGKKAVVKLRNEGAAWYALAYVTGLTEPEVKKIVADGGGTASGRTYKEPAPKPAAKPKAKAKAKAKGKKATGKKADPS